MEIEQKKSIIEAILFAAGRPVSKNEFVLWIWYKCNKCF